MNCFSYIVTRDFGFAPNPFGRFCTLATCKPRIRKKADVGDWIFGLTPKHLDNNLVYAMRVNEKLTFNQYWFDNRFQYKKTILNGSLKKTFGDNIYYFDESTQNWHQADSHHSLENGVINERNLNRDTKGEFVLISSEFFYFGINSIPIAKELKESFVVGINHRIVNEKIALKLIDNLMNNFEFGFHGKPRNFNDFERYDGVS